MCLIGNTKLLFTQCTGIGPHLAVRGKPHGFTLIAMGAWGIFSSYGRDDTSKPIPVQRCQA